MPQFKGRRVRPCGFLFGREPDLVRGHVKLFDYDDRFKTTV